MDEKLLFIIEKMCGNQIVWLVPGKVWLGASRLTRVSERFWFGSMAYWRGAMLLWRVLLFVYVIMQKRLSLKDVSLSEQPLSCIK
ncbi:hypothetical protein [Sporosarcina obsidiansis]|uniref:hypothetical protein n=1 Tax=Sporosarcina obsidiansis TaxID=2660748 RepID=UPI00129A8A79|nr:hypothetical protein [Sporosarcina obsidiansis]